MSAPVKNNQAPQNDPYADPYGEGYGDPYSDPYGDEYVDDGSVVDPYADEYADGEGGGEALTVDYARQYLKDLEEMLKASDLSPEDKKSLQKEITALKAKLNTAVTMSPSAQERILGPINEKLFELENKILCPEEGGIGDGSMKGQIDETRKKADEYLAQGLIGQTAYDKIMDDLTKAEALLDIEGESEEGSPQIQELIDSAQESLVSGSTSSEGAQKLGDMTSMDPAEIEEIAEKHGLDLENMPNPPTKAVIEFLVEINPELGTMLQGCADAVTALNTDKDAVLTACNQQNAANTACSSDNDNTDMTNFQKAYDIKAHTDAKSQDVMNKMNEFAGEVIAMLGTIPSYAGITITPPAAGDFAQAGVIGFPGGPIDLFNSSNGQLSVSTTPDAMPEFEIPKIKYDWQGDGDWEDHGGKPSVNGHGNDVGTSIYDDG